MFSINLHNCASHSPDVPGRAESQELSDPKRFTIVSEDISMRWKSMVLLFVASTLFLVAGTVIAQERSAQVVFTPSTPTFSFGMIGLGTTKVRLAVVPLSIALMKGARAPFAVNIRREFEKFKPRRETC